MLDGLKKKITFWFVDKEANKLAENTPKSWRTSIVGLSIILGALSTAALALFDDDPLTKVNWEATLGAITVGFGFMAARDQKAHEESVKGTGKDPAVRDLISTFILGAFLLCAAQPARAQYSAFLGASIDGSAQRNAAGHLCGIKQAAIGQVASISCVNMRGSSDGKPVYDFSQLFGFPLTTQGTIEIFTVGGGGLQTDANSTAGLLEGGLGLRRSALWRNFGVSGLFKLGWSPGNDLPDDPDREFVPRISVGIVYEPR